MGEPDVASDAAITAAAWAAEEELHWLRAVRERGLELRSLDLPMRDRVYQLIVEDNERRLKRLPLGH